MWLDRRASTSAPRPTVQLAEVAFPQAGVEMDGNAGPAEGDLGRLDRSAQIGGVDDIGVAAALPEQARSLATAFRELTVEPARRDAALVVDSGRVRLVDELHAGLSC